MNNTKFPLGLVSGLSIDEYHSGAGISKSGLDDLAMSPAHYYGRNLDPARPARTEKPGQLEGTLAHCGILEPEEFSKRYVVGPDVSRATKEWKAFVAEASGRVVIKPSQYEAARRQAESVRKLAPVAELLSTGFAEQSAYWIDEQTGELCRCRPDWAHPVGNGVILLDLKTCGEASPEEFARQIARKRYHVQDAFYCDGYAAASGRAVLGFVFAAVEMEWPYAACAVMIDVEAQEAGRVAYRRDLNTYHHCRLTGMWPGYSEGIEEISLPAWALKGE